MSQGGIWVSWCVLEVSRVYFGTVFGVCKRDVRGMLGER